MTSKMRKYTTDSAEFLVDIRRLPLELQWKIMGMVELFDFLNSPDPPVQAKTSLLGVPNK